MPKVTFEITPMVQVYIRGELPKDSGGFAARRDGGLEKRFIKWCIEHEVFAISGTGGHGGRGSYLGYYSAEDAGRIRVWLLQQPEVQEGL